MPLAPLVTQGRPGQPVPGAHRERKAREAMLVLPALPAYGATLDLPDQLDRKAQMVSREPQERQAGLVHPD